MPLCTYHSQHVDVGSDDILNVLAKAIEVFFVCKRDTRPSHLDDQHLDDSSG